jgi:hypothetical protein
VLGLILDNGPNTYEVDAPAQPTTLHIPAGRMGACSLSVAPGAPVVQLAVGEAGRAQLEDGLTSQALQAVARRAAGGGTGPYPSAASLATSFANATAVLANPNETPGDRSVGIYSDERTHLAVVARTMTGRRLYADFDGDVITTNLTSVADLIPS